MNPFGTLSLRSTRTERFISVFLVFRSPGLSSLPRGIAVRGRAVSVKRGVVATGFPGGGFAAGGGQQLPAFSCQEPGGREGRRHGGGRPGPRPQGSSLPPARSGVYLPGRRGGVPGRSVCAGRPGSGVCGRRERVRRTEGASPAATMSGEWRARAGPSPLPGRARRGRRVSGVSSGLARAELAWRVPAACSVRRGPSPAGRGPFLLSWFSPVGLGVVPGGCAWRSTGDFGLAVPAKRGRAQPLPASPHPAPHFGSQSPPEAVFYLSLNPKACP